MPQHLVYRKGDIVMLRAHVIDDQDTGHPIIGFGSSFSVSIPREALDVADMRDDSYREPTAAERDLAELAAEREAAELAVQESQETEKEQAEKEQAEKEQAEKEQAEKEAEAEASRRGRRR